MNKLGKCVCCAYQKRRNVTKVGRPTKKRTFRCPLSPQEFALRKEQSVETALQYAFPNQTKTEGTPTDNEQLLRLKRMSKSPHSKSLLRDLAL